MDGSGGNSMSRNNCNGNGNITRWNPTKEQISILEGLYGQGMRTPTADQIQRITSRLRAYGHIEGKNVFYWFQNHKARQRQKEKELRQQSCLSFSYLNRGCLYFHNRNAATPGLLYRPAPSPSSSDAVVFRPCYVPQKETAEENRSLYPKVLLPWGSGGRLRVADDESNPLDKAKMTTTTSTPFVLNHESMDKSTLDLFPVHPTSVDQNNQRMTTLADEDYNTGKCRADRPFFDFFSMNRCCGQD